MKNSSLLTAIMLVLVVFSFSCKKKKNLNPISSKNVCPLLSVADETGKAIQNYEYIEKQLIRIYSKDSIPTTLSFKYNAKNQVERMMVKSDNANDNFDVYYHYDDDGNLARTTTAVAGIEFMENVFVIKDKKITAVETTVNLFGKKINAKTRIDYINNNVSKVYTGIENDPELLTFIGEKYDDKPQFNPPVYKLAALGFVGISNNFFALMGDNNLVAGKIYDDKGKLDQKMNFGFEYDTKGMPTKCDVEIERNGVIKSDMMNFQFACGS